MYVGRTPTGSILTSADIADGSISTAKLADTAVSTAKIADDAVTFPKYVEAPSFRNRIINGDLSVAQRGTSFTNVASETYTIDRWNMSYRAVGNADIAQVDNKTYKSLKVTNSNGSAQEIIMRYRVEDITQFHNDSFILSFFAKASTSCTLDTRVFENYGSGGSTTVTAVASGSQNKTITTTRQRFTVTFTASDMSSKTIGTSNFLEINFSVSLASSANWEYDSVQLEQGTTASDFELIPFDVNLKRCQRYFETFPSNGGDGVIGYGYGSGSDTARTMFPFKVTKRSAPTMSDSLSTSRQYRINFTATDGTAVNQNSTSTPSFGTISTLNSGYMNLSGFSSIGGGHNGFLIYNNNTTLLSADAEL